MAPSLRAISRVTNVKKHSFGRSAPPFGQFVRYTKQFFLVPIALEDEEEEIHHACGPEFCGENYINVDRFFLVAMPLLFLVFNVVYWFAYGSHYFISQSEEVKITEID